MDSEPLQREIFAALLHRLEERPVELLLIEIARAIEKAKRSRSAALHSDRHSLQEEVREELIQVLGRILLEGKRNAFLRVEAAEILGSFRSAGRSAVPALIEALADEVSFVRVAVCEALQRIGAAARTAIEPLRATAANEDPNVRRAALAALGQIER